jgi:hypothetical protein
MRSGLIRYGVLLVSLAATVSMTGPARSQDCAEFVKALACPTGDDIPIGYEPLDAEFYPHLKPTVDQWFEARQVGDVHALLELTLSLSLEHQETETAWHRQQIDSGPLHGYLQCAVAADGSNPFHVWVFTPVVITLPSTGECHSTAIITEWILLDGQWYTFPQGAPIHSGAKKCTRPNSGYLHRLSEKETQEIHERLRQVFEGEPPN